MKTLTVGEIKALIAESSNEFKAVLGPNVESEDKKNNGKAYDDAKKRAKDYDGGLDKEMLEEKPEYEKVDGNKTTLDYNPENVSKEYKDRVKAQVKGYTSTQEMNNGIAKAGDYSDNEKIYNGIKDAGKKIHNAEDEYKFTKVQVRDKNPKPYSKDEMYESKDGFDMRNLIDRMRSNEKQSIIKEHVKTISFKKTTFLNEEHMISRIPDEFKKEGEQFKMRDKGGNEYLVEWKYNNAKILSHKDMNAVNESLSRVREMFDYTTNDSNTTRGYRMNENDESVKEMLDKIKKISN